MGANQSSLGEIKPKESLYDLLGAEKHATPNELKKAYRKIALQLHPDRNFNQEEEATVQFAKVQAAYDILSDPQEREWYDTHETNEYNEYRHPVTSTEELKRYMDPAYVRTMNPQKDEFYRLVSELFDRLRNEELEAAFEDDIDSKNVPVANSSSFGHIDAPWTDVKSFYSAWESFTSLKSFAWEDMYPIHHAADRKTKRAMENRNKRLRDAAKREYNDAVRSLVRGIRQLDVRAQKNRKVKSQERAQAEAKAKEHAAAQAKAAADARGEFKEQEWAKVEESSSNEIPECIACEMTFDSQADFEEHELSTAHIKAVKQLQREMLAEDRDFGLADSVSSLSVEDIMSELDQHKKRSSKTASPVPAPKSGKAKQRRQKKQAQQEFEFDIKCNTCGQAFATRNQLQEHSRVTRHV